MQGLHQPYYKGHALRAISVQLQPTQVQDLLSLNNLMSLNTNLVTDALKHLEYINMVDKHPDR